MEVKSTMGIPWELCPALPHGPTLRDIPQNRTMKRERKIVSKFAGKDGLTIFAINSHPSSFAKNWLK
jgi:hypothetical protein